MVSNHVGVTVSGETGFSAEAAPRFSGPPHRTVRDPVGGNFFALRAQGKSIGALQDISVDIGYLEFVTVVGPSGCESTLLKLIAGFSARSRAHSLLGRRNRGLNTKVGSRAPGEQTVSMADRRRKRRLRPRLQTLFPRRARAASQTIYQLGLKLFRRF